MAHDSNKEYTDKQVRAYTAMWVIITIIAFLGIPFFLYVLTRSDPDPFCTITITGDEYCKDGTHNP